MEHMGLKFAASTLVLATFLVASPAMADGVPAGTLIENTATAEFSDADGTPQTVDSNTVTVQVDELLDVTAAWQDGSAVAIGNASAVLTFEITNTGNGPEAFNLTAEAAVTGNDFDVTVDGLAYDTNGNGIYDDGVDVVLGAGAPTPSLDADAALTVFVLVSSPAGVTDGDSSAVKLVAQAVTGTGAPGTSFAGQGVDGSNAVVGTTSADADVDGSLIARLAALSLIKTASVIDPFGGSEAVPDATITFTIVANVGGSGSITDLNVTDAIPAGTTYKPATLTLDGAPLTDASDADAGEASNSGIAVDVGSAAAGASYTVTFDVTID